MVTLTTRGKGAIGVALAAAVALLMYSCSGCGSTKELQAGLHKANEMLAAQNADYQDGMRALASYIYLREAKALDDNYAAQEDINDSTDPADAGHKLTAKQMRQFRAKTEAQKAAWKASFVDATENYIAEVVNGNGKVEQFLGKITDALANAKSPDASTAIKEIAPQAIDVFNQFKANKKTAPVKPTSQADPDEDSEAVKQDVAFVTTRAGRADGTITTKPVRTKGLPAGW